MCILLSLGLFSARRSRRRRRHLSGLWAPVCRQRGSGSALALVNSKPHRVRD